MLKYLSKKFFRITKYYFTKNKTDESRGIIVIFPPKFVTGQRTAVIYILKRVI